MAEPQILLHRFGEVAVAEFQGEDLLLRSEADARDLIIAAMGERAGWVALNEARIDPRFFHLKTGLAGEVLQKFVNYHMKLAIIGDISRYTDKSESLAALVRESNRRRDVRFVATIEALTGG